MADVNRIITLIIKNLDGELSTSEQDELQQWIAESEENRAIAEEFASDSTFFAGIREMYGVEARVWDRIQDSIENNNVEHNRTGYHESIENNNAKRISWIKWIAAASVVVAIGIGSLLYIHFKKQTENFHQVVVSHDILAPAMNRATITLQNGQKVFLDSVSNGDMATQANVHIAKLDDGQIAYNTTPKISNGQSSVFYNILTNPRGSKTIVIKLSDGSRVWLNAASSLRYPVAFDGKERVVEITGEGYFEVVHNDKVPFVVMSGYASIRDIGTAFNVNAYAEEGEMKTTLISGAVEIRQDKQTKKLRRGEQAQIKTNGQIVVATAVDTAQVMAWKNGLFYFNRTDIRTAMRQIARWYDVDVVYEKNVSGFFSGKLGRKENASELLRILEMTGEVHFQIEGKKIIVMP